MEIRVDRPLRLDQLDQELRALPGLSRLTGLSAMGPDEQGETLLILHVAGAPLTAAERAAAEQAVARHEPDETWGLSERETELRSLLSRPVGSLTLPEVESMVRALADVTRADAGMPFGR